MDKEPIEYVTKDGQKMFTEQEVLYDFLLDFMTERNHDGIELTESDMLAVFRTAKEETGYFKENGEYLIY